METDLATIELQDQDEGRLACVRPHRRGACHARGLGQAPRNGKWNLCYANRGFCGGGGQRLARAPKVAAVLRRGPRLRVLVLVLSSTTEIQNGTTRGGGCQDSRSEGPIRE